MESSPQQNIGAVTPLTLIFVTLKLTKTIDWSWWWVLSPLWICASCIALLGASLLFVLMLERRNRRKTAAEAYKKFTSQ